MQASGFGQITRKGYVDGWKATGITPSPTTHKSHIQHCISQLSTDIAYFRKVYRGTFVAGKEADHKALALDDAIVYWDMMFTPPGRPWVGKATGLDWLATWKNFLSEKWTRSVNRDMWNQTLEFALKSMEDEELTFWSEDGAWPGVIDEFVVWWREKRCSGRGNKENEVMEVDD